jgi:hypothetical protein
MANDSSFEIRFITCISGGLEMSKEPSEDVGDQGSMDNENIIAGFPENAVLQALEHNLWEFWSWFGRGPDCVLHDEGDALWFESPIPTLPYNTVLRFAVTSDVDSRLDSIIEHYHHRRVAFLWIIHPSSMPKDLGDRLSKRGLVEIEVCSGMAANLANMPQLQSAPEGFEIRELCAGVANWEAIADTTLLDGLVWGASCIQGRFILRCRSSWHLRCRDQTAGAWTGPRRHTDASGIESGASERVSIGCVTFNAYGSEFVCQTWLP